MTAAELLTAWREAIRAAELSERLAAAAAEAAANADVRAHDAAEVADLAEQVAASATRVAERARATALQAAAFAANRDADDATLHDDVARLHAESEQAASAYHDAETETRSRQDRR